MNKFQEFISDEGGASAAEYALILAIIGAGIVASVITLQGAISDAVANASECLKGSDSCA